MKLQMKHGVVRMLLGLVILNSSFFIFPSCSSMLDTDSEMVQFEEDNTLTQAKDTLYSVMGVIRQMQEIADRTILLGEVRSDLLSPTPKAMTSIKELAAFQVSEKNAYNSVSDYYAVINNCNYFIHHVDTTLTKLGRKIFEREYAVVKTYRAWTYLQLAKTYGKVPLMLEPATTEQQAEDAMNMPYSDVTAIANYFIDELKPFVDTQLPNYNAIPQKFFIPVRVLLGELCLWAGRYQESAQYFYEYLAMKNQPVYTGKNRTYWSGIVNHDFTNGSVSIAGFQSSFSISNSETITYIPMESNELEGVKSYVGDVYNSTENNYYFAQVLPSAAMRDISAKQSYCLLSISSNNERDTTYAPKENLFDALAVGDLRLYGSYSKNYVNRDETSEYSKQIDAIKKTISNGVVLYRRQQVYLMFAEALCRAGYPESALCVLKYGLRDKNVERYISERERERAGSLLHFDDEVFTEDNTIGIHARGCGDAECDTAYCLPQPEKALATYQDTINYQIPLVEDMIITEMALEQAFEGQRLYNLIRVALRRNDPSYVATPIAKRDGEFNNDLYNLLMDPKNWYLPLR